MLMSFLFVFLLFISLITTIATTTSSSPTSRSFGLRGKHYYQHQKRLQDESYVRKLKLSDETIFSYNEIETSALSSYNEGAEVEKAFLLSNIPMNEAIPLNPFVLSFQFNSTSLTLRYDLDTLVDLTSNHLREQFYLHDDSCVDVTLRKNRRRRRRGRRQLQEKSKIGMTLVEISFEGVATFISNNISVTNDDVYTWQVQAFSELPLLGYHDKLRRNQVFLHDHKSQNNLPIAFTIQYSKRTRPN